MKRSLKTYFNLAVIVVAAVVLLLFVLFSDRPDRLLEALRRAHSGWLLAAGGCMLFYWLMESWSLYLLCRGQPHRLRFTQAVKTSMIGQLFNCITPFASGGQPVQAYYMVRSGVPLGESSGILLAKFILYQSILTIYSLVVLVARLSFFQQRVRGFSSLVLIGFAVNLAVVLGLIAIGLFPGWVRRAGRRLIPLLHRVHLVRDPDGALDRLDRELDQFYSCFRFLRRRVGMLLKTSAVILLQLTAYFFIPYFVCRSLGLNGLDPFTLLCAAAFVLMISSFVPLPGASGGAEGSFYLFFGIFFNQAGMVALAVLIWRIITFYLPIAVGMFFGREPHRTPEGKPA